MPYKTLEELPEKIRSAIPIHAQSIYLKAFNNALKEYQDPQKRRGSSQTKLPAEVVAHKVAWAAVKKKYKKEQTGHWTEK